MELSGFVIARIDVDRDVADEYNRWYDLDHGPEAVSLPGIIGTRRYHASPELVRGRVVTDLGGGAYELLTIYWLGDDDLDGTLRTMTHHLGSESEIAEHGRLFAREKLRIRSAGAVRRASVHRNAGVQVRDEAVPYLGHLGVYVEMWEGRAGHGRWLDEHHVPGLVGVPGVLAAIRLEHEPAVGTVGSDDDQPRLGAVVTLLDQEPEDVAPVVCAVRPDQDLPSGLRRTFGGAYRLIVPLRYDFARRA